MVAKALNLFFKDYISKESIFTNKKALQDQYVPKMILHRDKEVDELAKILAPSLRIEKPSNVFIYGKTGTGKSLVARYVTDEIQEVAKEKKLPLKVIYLNCKLKRIADTEYRLFAELARCLGDDVPSTGLPTDEIYKLFINSLEENKVLLLIILDEIDQLVAKTGDEILYNLTRLNSSELKNSEIAMIGISNDLLFRDLLDPRIKSSLNEEEIFFHPYDAVHIQSILKHRASLAFKKGIVDKGVIEKCAAFAAREHGDARRALDLLRVAGELAERNGKTKVEIKNIDVAEEKIERDRLIEIIQTQPKQFKLTLYSILDLMRNKKMKGESFFTGDVYDVYKDACFKVGVTPLTQRRISDIINEFDMQGIINAKVISKGRYGKTREICSAIPQSALPKVNKILEDGLNL